MDIFYYFFILIISILNIIVSLFEISMPIKYIYYVEKVLKFPFLIRIYGFFVLLTFIILSMMIFKTELIIRFNAVAFIIAVYLLISSFLYIYFNSYLQTAFIQLEDEFNVVQQKRLVYFDSFFRLFFSLILIFSVIP